MAQIKRFTAKKDLRLDCGHTIKAGESFAVISIYACDKDTEWPLAVIRTAFEKALANVLKDLKPLNLKDAEPPQE
jgi:hypothetical protein